MNRFKQLLESEQLYLKLIFLLEVKKKNVYWFDLEGGGFLILEL